MAQFRSLLTSTPLLMVGLLLLTSCATKDTTAQSCQRLDALQEEITVFEVVPAGDSTQRVETVLSFTHELERIHAAASNTQLASAAETLAGMYRSIADVAVTHPNSTAIELMREVEPHLDVAQINSANESYLRICEV